MSEMSEKERGLVRLVVVSGGAEVFEGNLDDLIKRDLVLSRETKSKCFEKKGLENIRVFSDPGTMLDFKIVRRFCGCSAKRSN